MAWCSVKVQGQLCLYLRLALVGFGEVNLSTAVAGSDMFSCDVDACELCVDFHYRRLNICHMAS